MKHRFSDLEPQQVAIRKTLVLGGARDRLTVPESMQSPHSRHASVLNTLAIMALRQSLHPVKPPEHWDSQAVDSVSAVPDKPIRDLLCSLFSTHNNYVTEAVPIAAIDALSRSGRVPHPYDYLTLERWMKLDKHNIGAAARRWLSPVKVDTQSGAAADHYADDNAELTLEQLSELPVSVMIHHVRNVRQRNPVEGLALCEHFLNDQTAANRVKLLDTLILGLSDRDAMFLSTCLEDRAASVKAQATRLLSMIEGTEQHENRVKSACDVLTVGRKARLIGRGVQIDLNVPASVSKTRRIAWIQDLFVDIDPIALSTALELKPKDFCRGVGDPVLRRMLAISAISLGRDEMAGEFIKELEIGERLNLISMPAFMQLGGDKKTDAWSMMLKGVKLKSVEDFHWILSSLYLALRCKPDSHSFAEIDRNRAWRAYRKQATKVDADCDPEVVELLVAIVPDADRDAFATTLASFPPTFSNRARRLNQLYSLLERST